MSKVQDGGRTGILAREERKAKAEKSLQWFRPDIEFKIEVFGDGRGIHLIAILIYDVGEGEYVKDDWTLKDFLNNAGKALENNVLDRVTKDQKSTDIVKVSWACNVLTPHMDRMRKSKVERTIDNVRED